MPPTAKPLVNNSSLSFEYPADNEEIIKKKSSKNHERLPLEVSLSCFPYVGRDRSRISFGRVGARLWFFSIAFFFFLLSFNPFFSSFTMVARDGRDVLYFRPRREAWKFAVTLAARSVRSGTVKTKNSSADGLSRGLQNTVVFKVFIFAIFSWKYHHDCRIDEFIYFCHIPV